MRRRVVPRGLWAVLFFLTYPFGAIKTDLEKAFRRPDAPLMEQPENQDSAELIESERSTALLEHPGV